MRSRASAPASPRACESTPRSSGSRSRCSLSPAAPGSLPTAAPGSRSRRRAARPHRSAGGCSATRLSRSRARSRSAASGSPTRLIWPAALCGAGILLARGRTGARFVVGLSLAAIGVIVVRRPERDVERPRRILRVEHGRDRAPARSSGRGPGGSPPSEMPSAPPGSARRSAPRWPLACTTPCCRRSRSSSARRAIRAALPHWRAGRSASCVPGSTPTRAPTTAGSRQRSTPPRPRSRSSTASRSSSSAPATCRWTIGCEALVLAAREAMSNAAQHSGADQVSAFVDVGEDEIAIFVRDRGSGFDPEAVPAEATGSPSRSAAA